MRQVITKTSEQYQLEQKMKHCPECGTKATKDEYYPYDAYLSVKYYKCLKEDCGCEWKVVNQEEKKTKCPPPLLPEPPCREYISCLFGRVETTKSKEAHAKYKKELELWKKMYVLEE